MKFGLLKSKIEKCLLESYTTSSFKKDIFIFNELVLKNKNISKLYYLYDELLSNKGLNESIAEEYINQSINLYENTLNKIVPKSLKDIELWVNHIKTKNLYEDIDNLFSTNVTILEEKIKSKKIVKDTIMESSKITTNSVNIPIDKMVKAANKSVSNFISQLDEKDKKKLTTILTEDENKLKIKHEILIESVIEKLEDIKESETDGEVLSKIEQTINKVQNDSFSRMNYFKLTQLYNNI
jgi:hypothetical protein